MLRNVRGRIIILSQFLRGKTILEAFRPLFNPFFLLPFYEKILPSKSTKQAKSNQNPPSAEIAFLQETK